MSDNGSHTGRFLYDDEGELIGPGEPQWLWISAGKHFMISILFVAKTFKVRYNNIKVRDFIEYAIYIQCTLYICKYFLFGNILKHYHVI